MADLYELSIALDLQTELSAEEYAELRWHLGLGPEPEVARIAPGLRLYDGDEPEPLLGDHGAALKIGGVLQSALVQPSEAWQARWALGSRQEVHPDTFDDLEPLLCRLAARADDRHRTGPDRVRVGRLRFYESDAFRPLEVRGGKVLWR